VVNGEGYRYSKGMTLSKTTFVELVHDAIDTDRLLTRSRRSDCGAVLLFLGTTREWTGADQTRYLEYDAYQEMAKIEMQRLADEALSRWSIASVSIVHRLGRIDIAEASVAIVVSSPHRGAAFEAGQWLIDTLKQSVPIWKKDTNGNGVAVWLHPQPEVDTLAAPRQT